MKQHIKDIITPYVKKSPNSKAVDLAEEIITKEPGLGISHRTARYYVGNIKKEIGTTPFAGTPFTGTLVLDPGTQSTTITNSNPIPTVDDSDSKLNVSDYDIIDDNGTNIYKFLLRDGKVVEISEELVDSIFCAYSRSGLNYTKPQIVDSLGISYQDFGVLTNKLSLSKFSQTLGPHSMAKLSSADQYAKILRISTTLIDKFTESDNGVAEALIKEYKKKLMTLSSMETIKESQMASLIASLPSISIKTMDFDLSKSSYYRDTLQVVLTDMHIGMETENFNFFVARQQIVKMIDMINTEVLLHGIKKVTLLILGDLPHTISGLNHMNNWKDIEANFWGADAIIKPFELLALLASNIINLTGVYAVGGK